MRRQDVRLQVSAGNLIKRSSALPLLTISLKSAISRIEGAIGEAFTRRTGLV